MSHIFFSTLYTLRSERNCIQFAQNSLNSIYFKFATYFDLNYISKNSSLIQVTGWLYIDTWTNGDQVHFTHESIDLNMCISLTFIGSHNHILTNDENIHLFVTVTNIERHFCFSWWVTEKSMNFLLLQKYWNYKHYKVLFTVTQLCIACVWPQ